MLFSKQIIYNHKIINNISKLYVNNNLLKPDLSIEPIFKDNIKAKNYKKDIDAGILSDDPSAIYKPHSFLKKLLDCNITNCNYKNKSDINFNSFKNLNNLKYNDNFFIKLIPYTYKLKYGLTQFAITLRNPLTKTISFYKHLYNPCTCKNNNNLNINELKYFYYSPIKKYKKSNEYKYCKSIDCFNKSIIESIKSLLNCFTIRNNPLDEFCALNPLTHPTSKHTENELIRSSLFSLFIRNWLKIFNRKQFCFTSIELQKNNLENEMNNLLNCFGLNNDKLYLNENLDLNQW